VAEQGTASDDSRISVVSPDGQVYPFLEGLPSETNATGEVTGTNHPYFDDDGNLMIVQGEGTDPLSASLLLVDTTGFVPGDAPLSPDDIHTAHDIGGFVLDQGFAETNPYTLVPGPDGDLFVVDAAANAIIRRAASTGDLDVFATFSAVPNPTDIGPPMVDAVPTGIALADGRFYVGSLTGFPFANGAASIYEVDLDGNTSVFRDGLTTIVDVDVDPRDGELVVLQHAAFTPPPPFVPSSGVVLKLRGDGGLDTLASGLNRPSGMRFSPSGDLYISMLTDGEIRRLEATATGADAMPERHGASFHVESYPNPFHVETRVRYELATPSPVVVTIVNVVGQEVRSLLRAFERAGTHDVVWDGRDDAGRRVPGGLYFVQIKWRSGVATKAVVFLP
jgi:hypothetical protein